MELSAEAMEALNQAMAKQIAESNRLMSTQFQQQLEELNKKIEKQNKARASASSASESSSSEPLSPNAAIRLAKGKSQVGTSKAANIRTTKTPAENKETRFVLGGNTVMGRGQRKAIRNVRRPNHRAETIAGRRVYVESGSEQSEEEEVDSDHSQETVRRDRHRDRDYDPLRQQLRHLKIQYPSFHGTNDPEAYLDWERKMESNFQVQGTYERNKVKIAISEFNGYALLWWEQLGLTRQRHREPAITTWDQLVTQMRRKFVPAHYQREILSKLRRLIQGTKSVRDYYQELETLMIRADLNESEDMVMSRFLGGLNREIQDKVELQNYEDVQEMVHKAELIESQIKRRGTRPAISTSSSKPKEFSQFAFTK